ncbi:MAG: ATP synthase F0 subunit C [Bacteroidales bacterium]|jgi:F-type H+-transporting ATPase subunit c|nr:ATP synthase F0 subunit C [Bacteroidales bacterium]MDD2264149.1 ATP synthase F0 subunit C [Bacteroidales bacterium]MDD2831380.1 ATP synthase F0 subunit C [Bacteroidales bacterium]MDD3208374.1 ATP synthase F0 subunit C [Bacteroidales bacterium]MDD3696943.1 ATP synthase F0 subunit C [Bacteroidales bacterium]
MLLITVLQATAAHAMFTKLGAVLGAAIVVLGASFGISKIGTSAMEAIARQPEAADGIRMSMIIIGALVEGVSLFAIIVCLLVAL